MTGGKSRSRVAIEAEEKRARVRELDRRIRELNRQIERPSERPRPKPAPNEAPRLFPLGRFLGVVKAEDGSRRQPLLKERRHHRNRTILWAIAALILFIWALGKVSRFLWR